MLLIELHYLPSAAYIGRLLSHPSVLIESCENYHKGTFRNRCHIMTANGLHRLSVPLESGKHQKKPIRDVRISYTDAWHKKHQQTIQSAYGNAPYFAHFSDGLFAILESKPVYLFDLNHAILEWLLRSLKLPIQLNYSAVFHRQVPPDSDLIDARDSILPSNMVDYITPSYNQVFEEKMDFVDGLSVLDMLMCCGNDSFARLQSMAKQHFRNT
jgi:hypothetical protein